MLFILTSCDLLHLFSNHYTCELFKDAIYFIDTDGSNLRKLVSLDHIESNCEDDTIDLLPGARLLLFTPDGNKIIYCTNPYESNNNSLYSVNCDGSDNTLLTEDLNVLYNYGGISISCIESKIIFIGNVKYLNDKSEKFSDIFMVNLNGSNLNNITNTYGINEKNPRFLPNGEDIIYSSINHLNDLKSYSINKLHLNSGSIDTLVFNNEYAYKHLLLSQEGTQIYYVVYKDNSYSFFAMNSTGIHQVQLYENIPSINNTPSISSDGLKIVYVSNHNLCIMNTNGSGINQIETSLYYPCYPTFSQGGTKILYSGSAINDSIYIININGSNEMTIHEGFMPALSPDENKIAFSGYYFYKTYDYWE